MPRVDLIATKDFTYSTRRLTAGDSFQARNRDDAKILIELLGKARLGRPAATVAPPPAEVVEQIEAVIGPTVKAKRRRKAKAKK
jgi:hypothetical protein